MTFPRPYQDGGFYADVPHAFYSAEFVVHDREGLKPYSANVESAFLPFSVHSVVRDGKIAAHEDEGPKGGLIMIKFDSMDKAQGRYHSRYYQKLMPVRRKSATSGACCRLTLWE